MSGGKLSDYLKELPITIAESSGIFGKHKIFRDYLDEEKNIRWSLIHLFDVLNTPLAKRAPYLDDTLKKFPYVNGGLFAGAIEIPNFTLQIKELLLEEASIGFNWSGISPTIFGAVFESTLNPTTRRSGGMHYTSVENIHKVIDPLFLDNLRGGRLRRVRREFWTFAPNIRTPLLPTFTTNFLCRKIYATLTEKTIWLLLALMAGKNF